MILRRILLSCIAVASLATAFPVAAQEASTSTPPAPAESNATVSPVMREQGQYERGVVEEVTLRGETIVDGSQQVKAYRVRFLSGPLNGQVREMRSDVGSNPYGLEPRQGDKVVVFMQPSGTGDWNLYLEGYDRRAALFWLVVLFVLTLVLLSGWQGVKVAFSIIVSIAMIGYILIPLFLRGANPVPVAIILAGVFTLLTAGFTTGWNRKAIVTAVGTMGGALIAYIISIIFANWANLSGLSTEEDRLFFEQNPTLNPRGLLFAGIIIAAVGVLEDVAVSIASGVSEVRRHHPRATFKELFVSGMVVGRDHMGALANTLVFAYVGASLSSLLLYSQFGGSWLKFINFDSVTDEVIRSLAGTIGLVFTVPITAVLAAWAMVGARGKDPRSS